MALRKLGQPMVSLRETTVCNTREIMPTGPAGGGRGSAPDPAGWQTATLSSGRHRHGRRFSTTDPATSHPRSTSLGGARGGRTVEAQTVPASLTLPPIDRLPSDDLRANVLMPFVKTRARPWGGVAAPLSRAVTAALWVLLLLDLALGCWLIVAGAGTAPCSGTLCSITVLGGHPQLTLVLAGLGAGALVAVMPCTRGLSRAGGPQLAVLIAAALCGVVALAGVVALVLGAALCLLAAFGIFSFLVDRM